MTTSASARILGVANILVGAVMAAGGFLEAAALARASQPAGVRGLALLGGGAGMLLLASGATLWIHWRSARRVTLGAAILALVTHGAAFGLASPGVLVLLIGVAYPVAVLVLLWSRPSLGSGQPASAPAGPPAGDGRQDGARLRVAMA